MITQLTIPNNCDFIMVIIDLFSKAAHFIPCKEEMTAPELAKLFMHKVFCLHGLPDPILSDRVPTFTSSFWQLLMKLLHIDLATSTAFHPQTNGQTEWMNKVVEDYLCQLYPE
jgi:hypothetical protein